jgi:hypothetical protein
MHCVLTEAGTRPCFLRSVASASPYAKLDKTLPTSAEPNALQARRPGPSFLAFVCIKYEAQIPFSSAAEGCSQKGGDHANRSHFFLV